MNIIRVITLVFLSVVSLLSFSQNRISLSKRSPVYMDLHQSFNAGAPKRVLTDDSQWLNFTTMTNISDPTLKITAQVAGGNIPEGIDFYIEALPYKGMSKGNNGISAGKIKVTSDPRVLIYDIGSCYTGYGKNEGYQLVFSFVINDYAKVKSGEYAIYVQYTISQ